MSDASAAATSGALPKPRLKWRKTWPDRERDYIAIVDGYPGGSVCRIYEDLAPRGAGIRWFWSMTAHSYSISRAGPCSGYEATAREAALAAEASWFRAIVGTVFENGGLDGR